MYEMGLRLKFQGLVFKSFTVILRLCSVGFLVSSFLKILWHKFVNCNLEYLNEVSLSCFVLLFLILSDGEVGP